MLRIFVIISVFLVTIMFLGGEPASTRGFYYVVWLSFAAFLWRKQKFWIPVLEKSPLGKGAQFMGLGVMMIIIEETFAGIAVHLLDANSFGDLISRIPPYYANNLLLLPGFIIAWYLLLKRYEYSRKEVFVLVGLFGLFAEKIYVHILTFPFLGAALVLPTMFTYMGIIAPSLISLNTSGPKKLNRSIRYSIGLLFPILVSLPFLLIHAWLSTKGFIDPSILLK